MREWAQARPGSTLPAPLRVLGQAAGLQLAPLRVLEQLPGLRRAPARRQVQGSPRRLAPAQERGLGLRERERRGVFGSQARERAWRLRPLVLPQQTEPPRDRCKCSSG